MEAHTVNIEQGNVHIKWFFILSVLVDFLKSCKLTVSYNINREIDYEMMIFVCLVRDQRIKLSKEMSQDISCELFYMAIDAFEWVLF